MCTSREYALDTFLIFNIFLIVEKVIQKVWLQYKNKIDRYIIYKNERWMFTGALFFIYIIRVLMHGGFYVISYILGLYTLHASVKFV